ncbi:MAG: TonB-dependent receptor [Sinimarinibacterium sp.]|jgi:iron complex outermembrane receptor protein
MRAARGVVTAAWVALAAALAWMPPRALAADEAVPRSSEPATEQAAETIRVDAAAAPASTETVVALEEVVVTAQKREQSELDVPMTVDTFTARDIERTGALTLEDIQSYIPGFEMGEEIYGGGMTQNGMTIRGIWSSNISTGGDPSVATFLDGVYLPRAAITVAFSDIERVEVLKGPQGTLFGRNAAAGVVNVIPNAPKNFFSSFLMAKLGDYGLQRYEGMLNVPLGGGLALRANALTNARDAVVENMGPAKPDPRMQDNQFGRLALRWDDGAPFRAQLAYDIDRVDNGPKAAMGISPEYSQYPNPQDRKLNTDAIGGGERRNMDAWTGRAEYDFAYAWTGELTSSYRRFDTYNLQDEDGTGDHQAYVHTNNVEDSDIFYNELQLNYVHDELFTLVLGATYSKEHTYQLTDLTASWQAFVELASSEYGIPQQVLNDLLGPAIEGQYLTETMTNTGVFDSYGIYGDVDLHLTKRLNVLFGLRYSADQKWFSWLAPVGDFPVQQAQGENFFLNTENGGLETDERRWDQVTGRLVTNYRLLDSAIAFLSYATGYKSGGFDSLTPPSRVDPLEPESVKNLEAGLKGDFFKSRVRAQLALFATDMDDRQEAIESKEPDSMGAVPRIINTDEKIRGVELTLDWLPLKSLRGGVVWTWRKRQAAREAHYDAQGNFVPDEAEESSTPQEYTVTLDWLPANPLGDVLFHVDYVFDENTDRQSEEHVSGFDLIEGYGDDSKLLNARIAWTSPSQRYELALWGKNLLESARVAQPNGLAGAAIGAYHVAIEEPRTAGIDLRINFW